MYSSPVSAYTVMKNPITNAIQVYYNDMRMNDEESIYTFNPDGSASVQSCAWGCRSDLPAGTFSDLMFKLSKTDELNSAIGFQLAKAYRNYARAHENQLNISVSKLYA